jgi:hypothetical protein
MLLEQQRLIFIMAKVAMQTYTLLQSRANPELETIPVESLCIFCLVLLGVPRQCALYSGSII